MSEILVDNLTGKTAAGSIVIYGEGGTATTNLQQGLAKVWANIDGTGTVNLRDSLNTSGITDVAAGVYTTSISSNLANTNYVTVTGCDFDVAYGGDMIVVNGQNLTSSTRTKTYYGSAHAGTDNEINMLANFGDLA